MNLLPEGYNTVTPYLIVKNAKEMIRFYEKAFGAKERLRFEQPDGRIGHAEIEIGNSVIMLADEFPEENALSPFSCQGSPVKIHLYVPDVDTFFKQAVNAGATVIRPIEDQFFGDRSGGLEDPSKHANVSLCSFGVVGASLSRRLEPNATRYFICRSRPAFAYCHIALLAQ